MGIVCQTLLVLMWVIMVTYNFRSPGAEQKHQEHNREDFISAHQQFLKLMIRKTGKKLIKYKQKLFELCVRISTNSIDI